MPKPHTVQLQGQEFTTYEGLLSLAHEMGLKSIRTHIVELPHESNGHRAVSTAEVEMKDGKVFTGIGDADPKNVNRMIGAHVIRMSETRAKARALRDATNMGAAAIEELGPDAFDGKVPPTSPTPATLKPTGGAPTSDEPTDPPAPPEPTADDIDTLKWEELYVESTNTMGFLGLSAEFMKAFCKQHQWPEHRKDMSLTQLGVLVRYLRKKKAEKLANTKE